MYTLPQPLPQTPPCAALRRSNLVDMSHDMSIQFGQEVPLYSKPPNWPASPPPAAPAYARPPQGTFQAHNPIHGCAPPWALRQPWKGLWESLIFMFKRFSTGSVNILHLPPRTHVEAPQPLQQALIRQC